MGQKEQLKTQVFWDVTSCSLVTSNWTANSYLFIYLSTWRHIAEKSDPNQHYNYNYRRKTVADIFRHYS
jgi:hypothetical protein